jgi:hypothetical protein
LARDGSTRETSLPDGGLADGKRSRIRGVSDDGLPRYGCAESGEHVRSIQSGDIQRTGAVLFVESSPTLAAEIARLSGKSVLSLETRITIDPALLPRLRRATDELPRQVPARLSNAAHTVAAAVRPSTRSR